MSDLAINSRVRLLENIYEHADDYSPGRYLAMRGEVLVVRELTPDSKFSVAYVSHEHRTDNSFAIKAGEFEIVEGAAPAAELEGNKT